MNRLGVAVRVVPMAAALVWASPLSGQAACTDPTLRALRAPVTPDTFPTLPEFGRWPLTRTDEFVSVGHISARDAAGPESLNRALIPFFDEPGGAVSAWVRNGWLVPTGGSPVSLSASVARAYLTDGYEYEALTPSFVAKERRSDGWIAVSLTPAFAGPQWMHECFFVGPDGDLSLKVWAEVLARDLFFRNREDPQALHAAPSADSAVIFTIPVGRGESTLDRLEVAGNWMRVRVRTPNPATCGGPPPAVQEYEGWVRWRNDGGEVLLRTSSGGC